MNISARKCPSLSVSLIPVVCLIVGLVSIVVLLGADAVQTYSQGVLLAAAFICLVIAVGYIRRPWRSLRIGMVKSAVQVLPTIPILLMIATVSATWMMSGVVPTLICYGLHLLEPKVFLITACAVCAVISVLSGSSWTTIATIGVAFMGIGTVWGYSPAWTAGTIISGAYFGDKVSPLSDTTVLASSTCGVSLFPHIRYLMWTTVPAMVIAMIVFGVAGVFTSIESGEQSHNMVAQLSDTFNITPWTLLIPAATVVLITLHLNTALTLGLSTIMGIIGIFVFQPSVLHILEGDSAGSWMTHLVTMCNILLTETSLSTGNELLDSLVTTGGMEGMLPTIFLILSAMVFGGALMGSGMLSTITHAVVKRVTRPSASVSSTVATGLMLNACTGDQYLSIILNGNLYRNLYKRNGLESRLLSRSIEDSTSVTSVLIPWNSCGLTQSAVLGVATLTYLPYCVFNIVSPLISIAFAAIGFRIRPERKRVMA